MCDDANEDDRAVRVRLRGLHGQHHGPLVPAWRGGGVAHPAGLRGAGGASPQWALDTLGALIRDGELTCARQRAESLTSFWTDLRSADALGGVVGRKPDLGPTLSIAYRLDDAELSAMLLAPFRLEELTPAHAAVLAATAERHGEHWTRTLLAGWSNKPRWDYALGEAAAWLAALPELCSALRDANGHLAARLVLAVGWEQLTESLRQTRVIIQPSRRAQALDQLTAPIAGLLVGGAISNAPEMADAAGAVFADNDDAQRRCVVSVLRAMPQGDPEIRAGSGFDALARDGLARLESWLARPPRDPNDWSIKPPSGCVCAVCAKLNDFLTDSGQRVLDWPLKEQSRRHVHERIDRHELPVRQLTRRVGRPFTLQLTKTPALFEREKQERQAAEADLQWLLAVAR